MHLPAHPNTPVPDLSPFLCGPLHMDFVSSPIGGEIGLTHCPGRNKVDTRGRLWQRDLASDLDAMVTVGVKTLVTLIDDQELDRLGAGALPSLVHSRAIQWLHLPITDYGVPNGKVLLQWRGLLGGLLDQLRKNERVLLHCAAGMGRSGMMAATLLKASGMKAEDAIGLIRQNRPGTVETSEQEKFIHDF